MINKINKQNLQDELKSIVKKTVFFQQISYELDINANM